MSPALWLSLFLSVATLAARPQGAQQEPPHAQDPWTICSNCGGPYGDEQLALHATVERGSGGSEPLVRVVLENTGKRDTMVVLGDMLNNGARQSPDSLRLVVTTDAGEKRYYYNSWIVVGGRVDDLLVSLESGAAYSITLHLSNFVARPLSDQLDLAALKEPLRAAIVLDAGPAQYTHCFSDFRIWTGQLRSNEIELPATAAPDSSPH